MGRTCRAFPVDKETVSAIFPVIHCRAVFELREICVCRNRFCFDISLPIAHDGLLAGKLLVFSLYFECALLARTLHTH